MAKIVSSIYGAHVIFGGVNLRFVGSKISTSTTATHCANLNEKMFRRCAL